MIDNGDEWANQSELEHEEYQEILKSDPGYEKFLDRLEKERDRNIKSEKTVCTR